MREGPKTVVYELKGPFLKELQEALERDEVPSVEARFFITSECSCGDNGDYELSVKFNVLVNGWRAEDEASIVFESVRAVFSTDPSSAVPIDYSQTEQDTPAGILDLYLQCLSNCMAKIFPRFADTFQSVQIDSYSVNSTGMGKYKVALATVGFDCNLRAVKENQKQRAARLQAQRVTCQGVDTNYATMQCMIAFYNWLLWRLLRREKGMAIAQQSSN